MAEGKVDSSLAEPIANARVFGSHCIQLNMDSSPQICPRCTGPKDPFSTTRPSPVDLTNSSGTAVAGVVDGGNRYRERRIYGVYGASRAAVLAVKNFPANRLEFASRYNEP